MNQSCNLAKESNVNNADHSIILLSVCSCAWPNRASSFLYGEKVIVKIWLTNFKARYIDKIVKLPQTSLNGMLNGEILIRNNEKYEATSKKNFSRYFFITWHKLIKLVIENLMKQTCCSLLRLTKFCHKRLSGKTHVCVYLA